LTEFPGKGQDAMEKHDKFVSTMSFSRGASVGAMFAALVLSGCGSSHKQTPAKPDGGGADSGTDVSHGPEAGPEVSLSTSGPEAGPEISVLPAGPEVGFEVSLSPTDPESCAKATNVLECEPPGGAIATISSAPGAALLAKITVASGICTANACPSGCAQIAVIDRISPVGATCELDVTSMDGRSQSVRLTIVQNPAPVVVCCSTSGEPDAGHMVNLAPTAFSPSSVVVNFQPDAGAQANLDTDGVDAGSDVLPGGDGNPDVYVVPTDEQTCLKATGVPSCDVWGPSAQVTSANAGLLLAKAQVTAGPCVIASECASPCSSISVIGTSTLSVGATCDVLVTAIDGRSQSLRLTAVANPSPSHMCCGYPQPPRTGMWTALDPTFFFPSPAAVDFDADGGAPIVDGGRSIDVNRAD
jgi:hypothetical protein